MKMNYFLVFCLYFVIFLSITIFLKPLYGLCVF